MSPGKKTSRIEAIRRRMDIQRERDGEILEGNTRKLSHSPIYTIHRLPFKMHANKSLASCSSCGSLGFSYPQRDDQVS